MPFLGCSRQNSMFVSFEFRLFNISILAKEPVPIDKIVCESSLFGNKSEMIYVNPNIDIMITQAFRENSGQQFNLTVEFQQCGGVIKSPNSGELTSPNFGAGQKYLPNSKCRWILEAPEGQVVKVKRHNTSFSIVSIRTTVTHRSVSTAVTTIV